jgi:DNA polymerase-3 subunit delta
MPEIHYKDLDDYLKKIKDTQKTKGFSPVYLIFGEKVLYKNALETLLDALISSSLRSFNVHEIDGTNGHIEEVIERINTYSLLSGPKVVALCDSRIFYSKQDEGGLLEKAREAYNDQNMNKAATVVATLLGILNLSFDDIDETNIKKVFKLEVGTAGKTEWLDQIIKFCKENKLSIPTEGYSDELLQDAIEKGFPKNNHLVITADMVDKRRKLFKIIKKNGIVIDCSVPKGDRRTDKIAQEAVLAERMEVVLGRNGKVMNKEAYRAAYELTGFDIETFSDNLEKLIDYVGDEKEITAEDVAFVLKRTRKDPIYELTNAVAERNAEQSLYFLNSLLLENFHPLQILASITNQIRKLAVIKDFAESSLGSAWYPEMQYARFASHMMTAIQSYNKELLDKIEQWNDMLSREINGDGEKTRKRSGIKRRVAATDLEIANNPYPVYKLMLNSEKFTKRELIEVLDHLSRVDMRLKYSKQKPKTVLEEAVLRICNTSIDGIGH